MFSLYIEAALRRAKYETLENGTHSSLHERLPAIWQEGANRGHQLGN
jgi:hypothetical protein